MSNIAGKAYAMNLVTPIWRPQVLVNKLIFWAVGKPVFQFSLRGLLTLSMIHYARWVILKDGDFPRLSNAQPREKLNYGYMLFFSNFNGSWEQYVDSFAAAIPSGLNLLWWRNIAWPKAIPEQPFHRYVEFNQIWTDYYYSTYPMAASNDVKAAERVKDQVCALAKVAEQATPDQFLEHYNRMLKQLQGDLGPMDATPIVSLAAEDIAARRRNPGVLKAARGPAPSAAATPLPRVAAANNQAKDTLDSPQPARANGTGREERTDAE